MKWFMLGYWVKASGLAIYLALGGEVNAKAQALMALPALAIYIALSVRDAVSK